uniref:Uncharacterized protein n=1 Tax=Rhizophora mucronata TaxID=61149 RepID=A0A2P2NF98_RHIMU
MTNISLKRKSSKVDISWNIKRQCKREVLLLISVQR